MATNARFPREKITTGNVAFSQSRSTIETAFYGNNVKAVLDVKEAYALAKASTGTIALDIPVYKPETSGLPEDAQILLFNDGETVGRFAGARVILGERAL